MNSIKSLCLITLLLFSSHTFGISYYINSSAGSDRNSGLSPHNAWQSIEKASKGIYLAGDKILLKAGLNYNGGLVLKSISGELGNPVLISSYGNGKATILSADSTAILATDCHFLDVENLICKGSGRMNGNNSNGVDFYENTNLRLNNIEASGYLYSGIRTTGGSDISIKNVYAHDNGYCGVYVTPNRKNKIKDNTKTIRNVYIGHSVAENNPGCPAIKDNHSGNGILVGGVTNATIEYCEAMNNGWDMPRAGNGPVGIWIYQSDSVIIQHCYAHHNKTSAKGSDGGGFDFDGGVTNSIMQYNFSMYNEGAGYGMFQYADAEPWNNNIVRYNISFHDGVKHGQCGIFMWCDPAAIQMKNLHAYNNTIVNKYGHGVNFLPGHYENFVFENNIFLITGATTEFTGGEFSGAVFKRNLYWSSFNASNSLEQPNVRLELNPIVADPLVVLPTSDSLLNLNPKTINTISFFKVKSKSPAINAGNRIKNNGGKDYWANRLQTKGKQNIGAHSKQSK